MSHELFEHFMIIAAHFWSCGEPGCVDSVSFMSVRSLFAMGPLQLSCSCILSSCNMLGLDGLQQSSTSGPSSKKGLMPMLNCVRCAQNWLQNSKAVMSAMSLFSMLNSKDVEALLSCSIFQCQNIGVPH